MKLRKIVSLLAACSLLLFILGGCGGDSDPPPEPTPEGGITLEDLSGFWYVTEEYKAEANFLMVEIFEIDPYAGTWTPYSEFGDAGTTLTAYVTDEGLLCLDMDVLGEQLFYIEGTDTLTDESGMALFAKGEPMAGPDYTQFTGSWFETGDYEGRHYTFFDDGTYAFYYYGIEDPLEEGTYTMINQTTYHNDGSSTESLALDLEGGTMGANTLTIATDGNVLLPGHGFTDEFYVRESALGTPEGDDDIIRYHLVTSAAWSGDNDQYIYFDNDTKVRIGVAGSNGALETLQSGTWELSGGVITLYWDDGTTDAGMYDGEEDGFQLESGPYFDKW